ncbi:MAG: carbohydrate ABC transporter permease [Cellulosilyticaceae bacterium]
MKIKQETTDVSLVRKKKVSILKRADLLAATAFLLPGIIFTIWLRYYPILQSFYMSLFDYNAVSPPGKFVGFQNYINIFQSGFYWEAWKNTFVFLLLHIGLVFFIPLVQAIFLNELVKGKKFFSTVYLVTALIPISINVIIWKWIWHPDYGLANQLLQLVGAEPQLWLSNPELTKFAIIFPGVIGGGVGVLLYLAAIQGVPSDIYEASEIDGCTGWHKIAYITMPNIKFIIVIQLILASISTMQILDLPYQYTTGGPSGASTSMGIYIYDMVNKDLAYGKSTAAACILFMVIGLLTMIQMRLDKSEAE